MFRLPVIEPNMIKYIKEHTNKSLEKYKTNKNYVNYIPTPTHEPFIYYYVPLLSLFSFLAGYNFSHIIKNMNKNK
jgi:hypothetical protein